MSAKLQAEVTENRQRIERLEALVNALKADLADPEFPPLLTIPPIPRLLKELGYVRDKHELEYEQLAEEMRPEEDGDG